MAEQTQTDTSAADAQGSGAAEQTGAPNTGAGAGAVALTQAQVDAIVEKRLSRAAAAHEKALAELQAKVAGYETAEQERQQASMTEAERLRAEAEAAKAAQTQALADAQAARTDAIRFRLIAQHAPELPDEYQARVTGADEEAIEASIATAQAAYVAAQKAWLGKLAAMPPEQIVATYGEEARPVAERLAGRPVSVGAGSNAGGQPAGPAPAWGPNNLTPEAWRKEREARGYPPIRPG